MSTLRADALQRLKDIVQTAERAALESRTAIARRASAEGRAQSGYFYKTVTAAFTAQFQDALTQMTELAKQVSLKSQDINAAVASAARDLKIMLARHLAETFAGNGNGMELPKAVAASLNEEFDEELAARLRQAVLDLELHAKTPSNSLSAWIAKNGWNILTAILAIAGLYLTWFAL